MMQLLGGLSLGNIGSVISQVILPWHFKRLAVLHSSSAAASPGVSVLKHKVKWVVALAPRDRATMGRWLTAANPKWESKRSPWHSSAVIICHLCRAKVQTSFTNIWSGLIRMISPSMLANLQVKWGSLAFYKFETCTPRGWASPLISQEWHWVLFLLKGHDWKQHRRPKRYQSRSYHSYIFI